MELADPQTLQDRVIYGFSAQDAYGNRIDPVELLPPEMKRVAAYYTHTTKPATAVTAGDKGTEDLLRTIANRR